MRQHMTRRGFLASLPAGLSVADGPSIPSRERSRTGTERQSSSKWPKFQYDVANTGVVPNGSGPQSSVEVQWFFTAGGRGISSPVVRDQFVYVTSTDGHLYAIDRKTGVRVWRNQVSADVPIPPVVANGNVYVAGREQVTSLDPSTGEKKWTVNHYRPISAPPVVANDSVHISDASGRMRVVSAKNGNNVRQQRIGDSSVYTVPAIAHNTIYVGSKNTLYAVAPNDLSRRWAFSIGTRMSSPTIAGTSLYVGSKDNRVYSLNAINGNFQWLVETDGSVWSSPAVAEDTVYVGSVDSHVYAIDARSGSTRWTTKTAGPIVWSPIVVGQTVYVQTQSGKLYGLNAKSGAERWAIQIGPKKESQPKYRNETGIVDVAPAALNGVVYDRTIGGTLYAIGEKQQ